MRDDDDTDRDFVPLTGHDLRDENPQVLANHLRLLQAEVRAGFESVSVAITAGFQRVHERIDDLVDEFRAEQASTRAMLSDHEHRIRVLEAVVPLKAAIKRATARRKK